MFKIRCVVAGSLLAVASLLPAVSSAHHRPDHQSGKPSPEVSPEPTPEPSPEPVIVNVELTIKVAHAAFRSETPDARICAVRVVEGSSLRAVLDAAIATECIRSYEDEWFVEGWGRKYYRLRCLDDVCRAEPDGLIARWWTYPNDLDLGIANEGTRFLARYDILWDCLTFACGF